MGIFGNLLGSLLSPALAMAGGSLGGPLGATIGKFGGSALGDLAKSKISFKKGGIITMPNGRQMVMVVKKKKVTKRKGKSKK